MKYIINIVMLGCLCITTVQASDIKMHSFHQDSYQQILDKQKQQPFVLIVWSINCAACLAEMELIHEIQQQANIKLIMLSVDGPEFRNEMLQIIQQNRLENIEQWFFAEDNSPALRYLVDKRWYGELPRTYFFDKQHQKTGVSGILKMAEYQLHINKMALTK
ncbi:MAG: redoxin domain-containing protein [Methyloprofundus sp.]|nr:redoxin domain-containing protein [Methyloprofundus sp.]